MAPTSSSACKICISASGVAPMLLIASTILQIGPSRPNHSGPIFFIHTHLWVLNNCGFQQYWKHHRAEKRIEIPVLSRWSHLGWPSVSHRHILADHHCSGARVEHHLRQSAASSSTPASSWIMATNITYCLAIKRGRDLIWPYWALSLPDRQTSCINGFETLSAVSIRLFELQAYRWL